MKSRHTLSLLAFAAPAVFAAEAAPASAPAPVEAPEVRPEAAAAPGYVANRDLAQVEIAGENDILSLKENHDRYYTNGAHLVYVGPHAGSKDSVWTWRPHYGIGQEIYTAADRFATNPSPDDHPYSAWAYGMIGCSWDDGESLDVLTFRLGVVGPSALGRQVQNGYHEFLGIRRLNGWDTQLHDEPGLNMDWRRNWRIRVAGGDRGFGADVIPMLFAEFGTVRDSFATGAQLRFGQNLPDDYGVSDTRKGGVEATPRKLGGYGFAPNSIYGFVEARGEIWIHNTALDGGMFHDSREVNSRTSVAQFGCGVAAHWGSTRLTFSQYVRTREFTTQKGNFWFGGVSLTQAF